MEGKGRTMRMELKLVRYSGVNLYNKVCITMADYIRSRVGLGLHKDIFNKIRLDIKFGTRDYKEYMIEMEEYSRGLDIGRWG
jgi:hypothetical protein